MLYFQPMSTDLLGVGQSTVTEAPNCANRFAMSRLVLALVTTSGGNTQDTTNIFLFCIAEGHTLDLIDHKDRQKRQQ